MSAPIGSELREYLDEYVTEYNKCYRDMWHHMTAPDFKTRLQKDLVGNLQGTYSRRINIQHRLVYQVYNEPVVVDGVDYEGTVKIIRMWTHMTKSDKN